MREIRYVKILVPTDGSDNSFKAAEHAIYLAKTLGARVFALNVVDTDMAFRSGIHYAEGVCGLETSGNKATATIKRLCQEAAIDCDEILAKGNPSETIVDMAEKLEADCIVIGSIGMSAIERILIGSVSEKVLRHAKCPVLLVHDKK